MTQDLPSPASPLRIGTRGSPLALAQAHETRARLAQAFALPVEAFEVVVIKTTGDDRTLIDADRPLKEIGNKGLFTKEIEEAMLDHRIDIAVHSAKDMPTEQPKGLLLECFLPREDPRDAFLSENHASIADLPKGAVVGSSSLRRRAQLLNRRPDLKVVEFRGNVQTRLGKLRDGQAAATFLAMAGLNRLGLSDLPKSAVETNDMLPAIAQGAICIERRAKDARAETLLDAIHCSETGTRVTAERSFLAGLDGSCETPIAGLATLSGTTLSLQGQVLRPDGSEAHSASLSGPASEAAQIGARLALALKAKAGPGFFDWHDEDH